MTDDFYGRSASVTRGAGTNIYVGGSYDAVGGVDQWSLGFIRIGDIANPFTDS